MNERKGKTNRLDEFRKERKKCRELVREKLRKMKKHKIQAEKEQTNNKETYFFFLFNCLPRD